MDHECVFAAECKNTFRQFRLTRPPLTVQVILGLGLGVLAGWLIPGLGETIKPLATLFIRMIKMLIAPLLFATLVVGITNGGDQKRLSRIGVKTILYFEVATVLALLIGLALANVLHPGRGISLVTASYQVNELDEIRANAGKTSINGSFWNTALQAFPTSIVDAMARGDVLQIVVFSVFFGLALLAAGEKGKPVTRAMGSLSEVMFVFAGKMMAFAPIGVFAAVWAIVAQHGLHVIVVYAKLLFGLYLALTLFLIMVPVVACKILRVPFFGMMRAIRDPLLLAFTTASSEVALPKAMQIMERLGVPKGIVGFVMPTGCTFNLAGSTLYLAFATIFVSQMAGIDLSLREQIMIMLTLMVSSKGMAAVPRVSVVVLTGTLIAHDLPVEGVALILGVDHFLDMGRTSVNLIGNCVATMVVARWEGAFDDEKLKSFEPHPSENQRVTAMTKPLAKLRLNRPVTD